MNLNNNTPKISKELLDFALSSVVQSPNTIEENRRKLMNPTTQQMLTRGSIRKFDASKPVSKELLDHLLTAMIQAPSYVGGQQFSVIVVQDPAQKEKVYEYTMPSSGKGMTFIQQAPIFLIFVMDFNKIETAMKVENTEIQVTDSLEALLIGTVDVGILVEAFTVAAESHGLGTVTVGAIRKCSSQIIKDFNLPQKTFPIVGMAVGFPAEGVLPKVTPRLPLSGIIHYDTYNAQGFSNVLAEYNETMKQLYAKRGIELSWTKLLSNYYSKPIYKDLTEIYKGQGFKF